MREVHREGTSEDIREGEASGKGVKILLPFCNALTSKDGKKTYLAFPVTIDAISEPL
jgi:hypothetical protein